MFLAMTIGRIADGSNSIQKPLNGSPEAAHRSSSVLSNCHFYHFLLAIWILWKLSKIPGNTSI